MNKTFHPESWSKQARRLADNFFEWEDKADALECLKNSYHEGLIKIRALKRFGRKMKKVTYQMKER